MTKTAFAALAAFLLIAPCPALADDNPLVGTIRTGTGAPAQFTDIEKAATEADFVLIGEIHTNAEHHQNQARLIEAMAAAGRKPAVVWEMVPKSLQGALDAFAAEDANTLGEKLDWEGRGWPDWAIYRPIAEAVLKAGLAMAAGDLDRDTIRAIGRGTQTVENGVAYPEAIEVKLGDEIMVAHCNLMPEEAIAPMISVQQARDLSMAEALIDAGGDGAVLIAGGGHTRSDWGVPFVLKAKAPERGVVSVGQFEVSEGKTQFADYLDDGETALPYDYVIFTTRSDDTDHCAELRERMGKAN